MYQNVYAKDIKFDKIVIEYDINYGYDLKIRINIEK